MIGGKSGVVNEATNALARDQLNQQIEYMGSKEYRATRDLSDVIPTHRTAPAPRAARDEGTPHAVATPFNAEGERRGVVATFDERAEEESDDDDLAALRARRLRSLQKEHADQAEWALKRHGTYGEITQDDFFRTVVREKGGSARVAVHFFHRDFERCLAMDAALGALAPLMMAIRICRMDVERSPFIVEKLKVNVLPCVVLFKDDVAVDRIVGFEGVGGVEVDPTLLRSRLEGCFFPRDA